MTRSTRRKIGDIGEEVACRFLLKHGFGIKDRNYLRKWGEIDIIAERAKKLYFIEVKTVKVTSIHKNSYRPEENVHEEKLARIHRAIMSYISDNGVSDETDWQADLVTVRLNLITKKAKVEKIENIL